MFTDELLLSKHIYNIQIFTISQMCIQELDFMYFDLNTLLLCCLHFQLFSLCTFNLCSNFETERFSEQSTKHLVPTAGPEKLTAFK